MTPLGRLLAIGVATCGGSCARAPEDNALELIGFRQHKFDSVALNEELVFYFSEELDRSSVTSDSVRILDEQGNLAFGERVVRGNVLSFLPKLPLRSDLSDGGMAPGRSYRAILGGFPRPDGIRSEAGRLLSACLSLPFQTAGRGGPNPLFLDPFVGPHALRPLGSVVSEGIVVESGRIELECEEGLDPSSLASDDFELSRYPADGGAREVLPLRIRLAVNRRNRAVLSLERNDGGLEGARLDPGKYYLLMVERKLCTLGGRAVEPAWTRPLPITVPVEVFEVDFATSRERSSNAPPPSPPGCDGTAVWTDDGDGRALSIRFPRSAGTGLAGVVELRERPPADLHASRLVVPAGAEVDLGDVTGPVVLRSQTSIEVRGQLLRRYEERLAFEPQRRDPLSEELYRSSGFPQDQRESLSQWLDRVLATEEWSHLPWTIVIAGGDIRVPRGGSIEVDGPLLLVAGGWIRIEGYVEGKEVWRSAEEHGNLAGRTTVQIIPLRVDAPASNLLREPLQVGMLSLPLRLSAGARKEAWQTVVQARKGAGRVRATFLRQVHGGQDPPEWRAVDPTRLLGTDLVLVQLEVPPGHGEPWDPPTFQRLTLEPVPTDDPPPPER